MAVGRPTIPSHQIKHIGAIGAGNSDILPNRKDSQDSYRRDLTQIDIVTPISQIRTQSKRTVPTGFPNVLSGGVSMTSSRLFSSASALPYADSIFRFMS